MTILIAGAVGVKKNFPLNVMYWVKNEKNKFEVLDGQQRTISICEYMKGNFSLDNLYFFNLTDTEKEPILDYKLMVYFCEGNDKEKLDWFRTINIAGEKLTDQELRNAIYAGTWVTDAKRYFSKSNCAAFNLAKDYLKGIAIRQEYLETAIKWINDGNVEGYMAKYQHKPSAIELWGYLQSVISWVIAIFPIYRKEMQGVAWGDLYNRFKDENLDLQKLETEVDRLMQDDAVTRKAGIYTFVLTGEEKHLVIRTFSDAQKREIFEKQKGICPKCKKEFTIKEMEADHITPWCEGGKTIIENCQLLCKDDNRRKSGK